MFLLNNIYYKILQLIIKIFIKIKFTPKNLNNYKKYIKNKKIIYILPTFSKLNLILLKKICYKIGLPNPINSIKINNIKLPNFIFIKEKKITYNHSILDLSYKKLINISKINSILNQKICTKSIHFILISIMFGRSPKLKKKKRKKYLHIFLKIKNILKFFWYGRDTFVNFSKIISLKKINEKYKYDNFFIKKLLKASKIYYIRQKKISLGPTPIKKKYLFNFILKSKRIQKILTKEEKIRKISKKKAKKRAIKIIKEIVTKYSYEYIRILDRILNIVLYYLYEKIHVENINRVYTLALKKYKIIYIPSHRSHIDYLLLSFILYHNGLAPPYIAAGINLNFFPLGTILRHLGAFFIQRSFSGKRLFSIIFQKYFMQLLHYNFSIEYFIEGKRSRTGFLIKPQTGILSLILETTLKKKFNQVALIPIYIGYESILEINSYKKEIKGFTKRKETFLSFLKSIKNIRKNGQSFINFGKPILLKKFINKNKNYSSYPNLMTKLLSKEIITKINNSTIVNTTNLCALILLSTKNKVLTKKQMIIQIKFYLKLLKKIPYSNDIILPNEKPEILLKRALKLKKIKLFSDKYEKIIFLKKGKEMIMSYFKNNILHLLIFPSLLANIILNYNNIEYKKIKKITISIFPLLQIELNIICSLKNLSYYIDFFLQELSKRKLIFFDENKNININQKKFHFLKILSSNISNLLIRYTIIFFNLKNKKNNTQTKLKKKIFSSIKKISILHNINDLNFLDKEKLFTIINFLSQKKISEKKCKKYYKIIYSLTQININF